MAPKATKATVLGENNARFSAHLEGLALIRPLGDFNGNCVAFASSLGVNYITPVQGFLERVLSMTAFPAALRPALLAGAIALGLAACGGASSSDEGSTAAAKEVIDTSGEGALAEMTLGNPEALVTVIEYASVTCPHCANVHETVYPTIKENYIDTGKIHYIFREFPTAPAELSVVGSMLARCAADKGGKDAYFLVLDSLFKTQGDPRARTGWIYSENPRAELVKIANQAGMDDAAFDACVRREELLDLINGNVTEGRDKYNINSTPSFVVNGALRHFSTADDFSQALDEALEKAGAE